MGERRGVYRVLVGKSEGKRPLGRAGHRSSRMGIGDVYWIAVAEGTDRWRAVVNAVMNHRVS
jgi:hypothetical protein